MGEIIVDDCLQDEEEVNNLITAFIAIDKDLAKLERRRQKNNFGKKLQDYTTKVNEEIEKIKGMNLPQKDFNKQVLLIYDYFKIFGKVNPLTAICVAERELDLLICYLECAKIVWQQYQNFVNKKYGGKIISFKKKKSKKVDLYTEEDKEFYKKLIADLDGKKPIKDDD